MNLKTATLIAAIGSTVAAVADIYSLIDRCIGIPKYQFSIPISTWVFRCFAIAFPACLAIFFFTLWRKQK